MEFRSLKADEVECRISTVNEKGLSLLLYKDARVDMRLLDETVGSMNWKRSHQVIDGNLYCTIEIWDNEKQQWIAKQDVGTESYTEKEKGQASDSFKRAGFNWGIGRELYTAPFIWIGPSDCKLVDDKKTGKKTCYDRFTVTRMEVDGGAVTALTVVNKRTGVIVFDWHDGQQPKAVQAPEQPVITEAMFNTMRDKCKEKGKSMKAVLQSYGHESPKELLVTEWKECMGRLDALPDKTA